MSEIHPEIRISSLSDVGKKRESNQDSYGEFDTPDGKRLLVCCDGMGGHRGGETASRLAVESIAEVVLAGDVDDPEDLLEEAFERAHERIQGRSREDLSLVGMGTTAVALLLGSSREAWIAHVGDTRAYRIRGGSIEQLTQDHSIVAEQIRRGLVTVEQASQQPRNVLSRALGASPILQVDVARHEAVEGDRFVLCTDGLWNLVSDRELAEAAVCENLESAARTLVDLANERGGTDNVTVQILGVGKVLPHLVRPGMPSTDRDGDTRADLRSTVPARSVDETQVTENLDLDSLFEQVRLREQRRKTRRVWIAALAALLVAGLLIWALVMLRPVAAGDSVRETEIPTRAPDEAPP